MAVSGVVCRFEYIFSWGLPWGRADSPHAQEEDRKPDLSFANTPAELEINNRGAVVSSPFWYNSWPCFDSSSSASGPWFASFIRVKVFSSITWHYANNLSR